MTNPVTAKQGYPLPVGNLADDLGRVTEALKSIDRDMGAGSQKSDQLQERLRKVRINALLGEDLLPL